MALVSFKRGVKPSDLSGLSADTIYFFTDTKEIYLGSTPYGGDLTSLKGELASISSTLDTVQSELEGKADAEDVEALETWKITVDSALEELENAADDIAELKTTVAGHTETLASIAGEQTTQNGKITALETWLGDYYTGKKDLKTVLEEVVGGKLPENIIETVTGSKGIKATTTSGNVALELVVDPESAEILEAGADGLKITLPEIDETDYTVTVTEQGTAETGYAKTYVIAQPGTELSAKINIPKDLVVSKGEIVKNNGSTDGTFIKLTLNNDDVIYIDVKDLVDQVEANNTGGIVTVTVTDGNKIGASIAEKAITATYLADAVNTDIGEGKAAYTALTWGSL